MEPKTTFTNAPSMGAQPQRVIPLLQSLARLEDLASGLALRLDPITQHSTLAEKELNPPATTVTGRINNVGDALQYLLDNIEL